MRVVVAMSGGVDSSVAAGLLVRQGHEVIGVHMKLHDTAPSAGAGHCCGLDDALDARRVAGELKIPFYVLDLQQPFRRAVMDDLADTYLAGGTPNPCVQCNGVLKFQVLLRRAMALGASHLATGHYVRRVEVPGGFRLAIAADRQRDQSYFLYPMKPEALERSLFPLGELTKPEVRSLAQALSLPVAEKPDSQEICFIPDDDHAAFVRRERPSAEGEGEIVDLTGRVLGRHDGYFRFTVGQRRGLGLSLGAPAFVVRVEPTTRRVVVSTDPTDVLHGGLRLRSAVWHERPSPEEVVSVRVRHRGQYVPGQVSSDPIPTVTLLEPARAVAPGQSAVFYRDQVVLGGGIIGEAWPSRQRAA